MQVDFSTRAERDLENILELVWARDGLSPAIEFTDRLTRFALDLGDTPHIGTRRPERGTGVRSIGYRRQATLLFREKNGRLQILRLVYGGQDLSKVSL